MIGKKGIIHVGANTGQEAEKYSPRDVIWVEPIPTVFKKLEKNISKYDNQIAFNSLIVDVDFSSHIFNISSNKDHASSSILELNLHRELFPSVKYIDTYYLIGKKLETLLKEKNIDLSKYDTLVLDTQGTELMILRSSINLLSKIKYVVLEVANFEAYKNCCTLDEVHDFFRNIKFEQNGLKRLSGKGKLKYFDATYVREEKI